ncbi:gamma-glutamyltransferase family protein [Mycobacterium sp. 21AC1]|uniref:gamma-glutamyltransferase family protein n=1 Tax=[Mycobacterium] appelbergii TaxID=2939269 RepID=UPI00293915F6|nr:gamma-glutamyltransferase [Mycobacterium sp. 21AC1]MDV3124131.1 gamma-glutamyltransferase family protein [Mycobacterium sp. 21AC1]
MTHGFLARPNVVGTFAASASTHWVASSVAQSVLERGGNAFDAATAAGFVLHIVEPHLNGPGGDLVGIVAPIGSKPMVLCGQGPAPAKATIEHFANEGLDAVPGSGALAAAVPGAVDAWLLLLRDHGTWDLDGVLSYAIHYATVGQPLHPHAAAAIAAVQDLFLEHWPTSAAQWLPDGRTPPTGTMVGNHTYADMLRRLCREARDAAGSGATRAEVIDSARTVWAQGFVAKAIEGFCTSTPHLHSSGAIRRGVIEASDLTAFRATWEAPVVMGFRGSRIYKSGPWGQGPVLLQCLKILEGFDDDALDLTSKDGIHNVVETLKLALADREAYFGDGLSNSALAKLLSSSYAATRRALISDQASIEFRPGRGDALPAPFYPTLRTAAGEQDGAAGEPTVTLAGAVRGDTCHIDVIDQHGNAISVTPSGGWLQSSPTIPELGFALGTRLQMSHLDPASPSALRPGRRPRTTLSPTLVDTGERLTVLGSPGGDQQDQWQLLYLLRTLVSGLSPQEAIESPMFHTTSYPGSFWPRTWEPGGLVVEDRIGAPVIQQLRDAGHRIRQAGDWSLGRLTSVTADRSRGVITAAANPRGAQNYAVGR